VPVTPTAVYVAVMLWSSVPFVPGEPVLIAAGSWSATNGLTPLLLVVAAAAGSFLSDLAKYGIGRLAGPRILRGLARRPAGTRAVRWIEGSAARTGAAVIVPSYFVPFGAVVSTILCGALRMPVGAVAVASAAGAALWATVFVVLGFMGGAVTGHPLLGAALALPVALALGFLVARLTTARNPARA
jgi:membrane-associated protein